MRFLVKHLPSKLRKDRVIKAIGRAQEERYITIPNIFDDALHAQVFSEPLLQARSETLSKYAARFFRECDSVEYLDHLLHIDTRLWLPDDLLTKVDRASMAYSLEARVPYLDKDFVELCAKLPTQLKYRGRSGKYILKKLAERYLPHSIVYRSKQGFVMPLGRWFRRELRPLLALRLSTEGLLKRNIVRPELVGRLLHDHFSGRRDEATRLWALVALELWFQRYEPDFTL